MLSSEEILENAARDGSIDITEWPRVLETVLQRLHNIVHNDFPIPSVLPQSTVALEVDPEVGASTPQPQPQPTNDVFGSQEQDIDIPISENGAPENSQSSTKENDMPSEVARRAPPMSPPGVNYNTNAMLPPQKTSLPPGTLPPDLQSMYQASLQILETDFAKSPPYTVQRLAEMVLVPKKHYRYLPAYLRALNRIISVSSPVSDFPLPTLNATTSGVGFLTNGEMSQINGTSEREGLGSDEALGGALLTPIPWLRNNAGHMGATEGELHSEGTETIEGPNGPGGVETVSVTVNGISSASGAQTSPNQPTSPTLSEQSDASSSTSGSESTEAQLRQQGGVTQGELLRQEQEAGVIPITQKGPRRSPMSSVTATVGRDHPSAAVQETPLEAGDEVPHARGPEEIGLEDLGPQPQVSSNGLNIEAAVGRAKSPPTQSSPQTLIPDEQRNLSRTEDAGNKLPMTMDQTHTEIRHDADGDVMVADVHTDDAGSKDMPDASA